MARFGQTILDDFNDNSLNTGMWGAWSSGIDESSSRLNISVITTSGDWRGFATQDAVDLTNALYGFRVVSMGTNHASRGVQPVYLNWSGENEEAFWYYENGTISCHHYDSEGEWVDVGSSFTWNSTTHAYLAIGVLDGQLSFGYSADGVDFTIHGSVAHPYGSAIADFGALTINWGTVTSTTVSFDDASRWAPAYPTRFFL